MKKFLFFPVEKDGRVRQIVNGVVTSINKATPLPEAPDGNQDISIGWERSSVYHGNIRNFGLQFGYVGTGRKILQNDFYKFTIDRELWLLIKQLTYEWNDNTFKEYYKQLYKGQFDFATAEDDQGNHRFNIGLMEGGLQRLLKANESTEYEIPFDIDAKNVYRDGMFIVGQFKWFMAPYESLAPGYPGLFQLNNDNPIPGLALFDVMMANTPTPDGNTLEYFAEATQSINGVKLTGMITDLNSLGSAGPLSVRFFIYNTIAGAVTSEIDLTPDDPYPEHYNLMIDLTLDLVDGDRLFLYSNSAFEGEGNLTIDAKSKPEATTIKGFTLYDLGLKLVEKITGSASNFESSLLSDLITDFGSEVILTSGDGVRGFTNAAIKTSWRDYYKFVDVLLMTQMTITDKIRIEKRQTAYKPESEVAAVELGNVKDFKITPAIDQMYTSIKVGHREQDVNDTNGKFDFNGYMVFTTPNKAIPEKQLDLQSQYKASPYEIEQTAARYEGKTTTDKETDNNVFAIAVQPDPITEFDSTGTFQADGTPFAPGLPFLSLTASTPVITAGMKLRFTNSVSNNVDRIVAGATGWFFGQLITFTEPVVDEVVGALHIEIIEGQRYTLDRSITIQQLTLPDVEQEVKDAVFNVRLSPKRILERHKSWLAGSVFGYDADSLVFSSANRNKDLIAGDLVEKANVSVVSLGLPMFIPKYFEFDTISPSNMVTDLEVNPNPIYAPVWNGYRYTGFFLRGAIALNDLEEQTFKLLACYGNNLLNLT